MTIANADPSKSFGSLLPRVSCRSSWVSASVCGQGEQDYGEPTESCGFKRVRSFRHCISTTINQTTLFQPGCSPCSESVKASTDGASRFDGSYGKDWCFVFA